MCAVDWGLYQGRSTVSRQGEKASSSPPPVVCPYLSLSSARLLRVYTHRQAGRQAGRERRIEEGEEEEDGLPSIFQVGLKNTMPPTI